MMKGGFTNAALPLFCILRKIEAKAMIKGGFTNAALPHFYVLRKIEAETVIKGGFANAALPLFCRFLSVSALYKAAILCYYIYKFIFRSKKKEITLIGLFPPEARKLS